MHACACASPGGPGMPAVLRAHVNGHAHARLCPRAHGGKYACMRCLLHPTGVCAGRRRHHA
eukprot:15292405-Alexandrium_andersonii.AAC.1